MSQALDAVRTPSIEQRRGLPTRSRVPAAPVPEAAAPTTPHHFIIVRAERPLRGCHDPATPAYPW